MLKTGELLIMEIFGGHGGEAGGGLQKGQKINMINISQF